jgi:tetratricopeptide (TPR) repeat protein
MGLGSIALSQSILSGTRRLGSAARPANAPPIFNGTRRIGSELAARPANTLPPNAMTTVQIEAALTYTFDPQLSAKIRADQIERVSAQNPALRPVLEKAFANNAILQEFEGFIAAHGYSSHNVADAMATLIWSSWQIANGSALTEAQIRGVHQQVRGVFLTTPALRSLTSAVRQTVAETIAYLVMIEQAYQTSAMRTGDPAELAHLRQVVAENVKEVAGVDISRLELTPSSGFRIKPASAPGTAITAAFDSVRRELGGLAECMNKDNTDFNRRIDACTRAITNNLGNKPVLSQAYLWRATAYGELRQFDRMIADSDELLRIEPQNPVYYLIRGHAFSQQHNYNRALADVDTAMRMRPDIAETYAERSAVYLQMGDFGRAFADSNQALSLKPGMATGYAVRAAYHMEEGDNHSALEDANQAIQVEPQNDIGYLVRAENYLRLSQLTEAQADADQALRINPRNAGAHDVRGRIALVQGKIDLALSELTQAIDLGEQAVVTVASRASAYERSGRRELALADYRQALQRAAIDKVDREAQAMARQRVALLDSPVETVGGVKPGVPAATPASGRRIALVIGMSAYANVSPLSNPASDARAVADAFRRLGFAEVVEREDLSRTQMEKALKDFGDKAADADWAVIYYAGHGVELDGVNYLVPVDAKLARADHVEDETVALTRLLSKAEPAHKLRVVILDACRINPFSMASAGRPRAVGRGLARVEPTGGVLVAYAARDGTTADDGADGHSPFTKALLTYLETPGLDIRIMFSKVRDLVLQRTHNAQEPFTYGSLPGEELYFKQAVAR